MKDTKLYYAYFVTADGADGLSKPFNSLGEAVVFLLLRRQRLIQPDTEQWIKVVTTEWHKEA